MLIGVYEMDMCGEAARPASLRCCGRLPGWSLVIVRFKARNTAPVHPLQQFAQERFVGEGGDPAGVDTYSYFISLGIS
jgi:hypothetical protein